jgi:hypothetical protein
VTPIVDAEQRLSGTVSAARLSRLCFCIGHVALQHLVLFTWPPLEQVVPSISVPSACMMEHYQNAMFSRCHWQIEYCNCMITEYLPSLELALEVAVTRPAGRTPCSYFRETRHTLSCRYLWSEMSGHCSACGLNTKALLRLQLRRRQMIESIRKVQIAYESRAL